MFWRKNGKKDRENFKWKSKGGGKSRQGGFRGKNKRGGKIPKGTKGAGVNININLTVEKGGVGIKGLL